VDSRLSSLMYLVIWPNHFLSRLLPSFVFSLTLFPLSEEMYIHRGHFVLRYLLKSYGIRSWRPRIDDNLPLNVIQSLGSFCSCSMETRGYSNVSVGRVTYLQLCGWCSPWPWIDNCKKEQQMILWATVCIDNFVLSSLLRGWKITWGVWLGCRIKLSPY